MMSTSTRAALEAQVIADVTGRRWYPQLYGHTSPLLQTGDLGTASALSPLLPNGDLDLTPLSSVTLGLSSTITGGGHTTNFGALSSTRSTSARAGGPTIDAVLAAEPAVRQQTPFDAIRVGVHARPEALGNATCAYGADRAAPTVMNPQLAYNNVFGSVAGAEGQAAFARRGTLLDYANADVTATLWTSSPPSSSW